MTTKLKYHVCNTTYLSCILNCFGSILKKNNLRQINSRLWSIKTTNINAVFGIQNNKTVFAIWWYFNVDSNGSEAKLISGITFELYCENIFKWSKLRQITNTWCSFCVLQQEFWAKHLNPFGYGASMVKTKFGGNYLQ